MPNIYNQHHAHLEIISQAATYRAGHAYLRDASQGTRTVRQSGHAATICPARISLPCQGNNNRTGELMSISGVSDRIIEPMIALAGCSPGQRIVVVGAKSMELMMDLQKRGYFLAASAGNCGLPAAQYDAALVDWRRRPLSALDAAMDWLDGFLGPRAVLVIWLDAQKSAAKDDLRAAVAKRGFVVLQGAEHPCGSALLARRSQAYPMQKAA